MSFKRLNEAFDLLNKVSNDIHINNDIEPIKAQEAKKFYGNKVRSKGAQNLENMPTVSPSLRAVKDETSLESNYLWVNSHYYKTSEEFDRTIFFVLFRTWVF